MITVVCAIIHSEGKILCAQRSEKMAMPLKWEFPGGKLEQGEHAVDGLVREIREELGIEISVEAPLTPVSHLYANGLHIELIPYLCTPLTTQFQVLEHQQIVWVEKADLMALDWAEADVPIVRELLILNHFAKD